MSKEFPYHQARKKSSSTRIWIKCDMPLEKVTIVCHSHEILISLGIIIWMIHANLSKIKIASAKFTANVLFTKVALKLLEGLSLTFVDKVFSSYFNPNHKRLHPKLLNWRCSTSKRIVLFVVRAERQLFELLLISQVKKYNKEAFTEF